MSLWSLKSKGPKAKLRFVFGWGVLRREGREPQNSGHRIRRLTPGEALPSQDCWASQQDVSVTF
jgi:hypothetical protein